MRQKEKKNYYFKNYKCAESLFKFIIINIYNLH